MKILKTSLDSIKLAMEIVNKKYENNITFSCESITKNKMSWKLRLNVVDSRKPGARRSATQYKKNGERRSVHAACWHVHGDFIDALFKVNPSTKIRSNGMKIDSPKDNWQDFNMGSYFYPCFASEACDC